MDKDIQFKDLAGKKVKIGDKVAVLVKDWGYRKLKNASLALATFNGKGQYGFEFKWGQYVFRVREPKFVKI